MKILLVGKRKQPITWASMYLKDHHKFARFRMLDGVRRIVAMIYGPIRYYDFPWEKRFNVYNAVYRSDSQAWVGYMERRLRKLTRSVVIDDPHYVNEVVYLADKLGFTVVRITMNSDIKPTPGKALLDSEPGTVLLQEYYGVGRNDAYKVDYTLSVYNRKQLYESLDNLVNTLKFKEEIEYNISEGSQEPVVEVPYEEEISTSNQSIN